MDDIGYIGSSGTRDIIFRVQASFPRLYDFPDNIHMAITYELDRDLKIVRRKVFNFLDWLGAIGGLAGALRALFGILIFLFQYKASVAYVGNHTYKIREGED